MSESSEFQRLRLDIAYDGTDFHGWAAQKDPGLRTVQGELERVLALLCRMPVGLTVAGRTDAGVHASGQVAHVDVPPVLLAQRGVDGDPARLVRKLAKMLPADIRVSALSAAPEGFDARFSALARHYVYRVSYDPAGPLPTRARDTLAWGRPLDVAAMDGVAGHLVGLHNFAAFCKPRPHATTIRNLLSFSWHDVSTSDEPYLLEARLSADAFCWSMVRSLVGACLAVGEGRRNLAWLTGLLLEDRRSPEFRVVGPEGLTLVRVDYPADAELATRARETRTRRSAAEIDGAAL